MSALRRVLGSFRLLRRRTAEVGQPGLQIWADCGTRAALDVQTSVRAGAHRAEVGALAVEGALRDVLSDGRVTPSEIARLKRLLPQTHRLAEGCHDLGEVVS